MPTRVRHKLPFCCRIPYGSQPLLTAGLPLNLHEGYIEEQQTDEAGRTLYSFMAAVDKTMLLPLFDDLVEVIASPAYAILELPPEEGEDEQENSAALDEAHASIYLSVEFDKQELLTSLEPYRLQLMLDGYIGFGVANYLQRGEPARMREVFLDDHKLIRIHDEKPEPWRTLLAKWGLPRCKELATVDMGPHIHQALDQFPPEELPESLRKLPWHSLIYEEYIGNLLEALQFERQTTAGADASHTGHPATETVH